MSQNERGRNATLIEGTEFIAFSCFWWWMCAMLFSLSQSYSTMCLGIWFCDISRCPPSHFPPFCCCRFVLSDSFAFEISFASVSSLFFFPSLFVIHIFMWFQLPRKQAVWLLMFLRRPEKKREYSNVQKNWNSQWNRRNYNGEEWTTTKNGQNQWLAGISTWSYWSEESRTRERKNSWYESKKQCVSRERQ